MVKSAARRAVTWLCGLLVLSTPAAAQPIALTAARSLGLGPSLIDHAMKERAKFAADIANKRYVVIIDYSRPSNQKRLFVLDLVKGTVEADLVAHGRGSDPDHDGIARRFSNDPGSLMSSLGAFVTGATYYGEHGLSLKLIGLESSNDRAEERAIVFHGASYVSPALKVLGRSWGCPAVEPAVAAKLIPEIANGAFVYAAG